MQLSTKPRYALRILLQLAEASKAVKGRELAAKQEITEAYIEQIMLPLKQQGLVKTVRGCNGGYMLAKQPEEITVLNVVETFEGEIHFTPCEEGPGFCPRYNSCPTRDTWQELCQHFKEQAATFSLKNILESE